MERCLKDSGDSANPRRTAQKKTPQDSAQGDPASRIDASPLMVAQRKKLQSLFGGAAQLQDEPISKPNNTGLPDNLKSGIESLSGMSMDHVKVHYNSSMPAQLNALAYAQGSDIHVAPGQEKHLPHEAWHVVQQAQGMVKPTMQMKGGVAVNDDSGLEREADAMGARAVQMNGNGARYASIPSVNLKQLGVQPVQRAVPPGLRPGRWVEVDQDRFPTRIVREGNGGYWVDYGTLLGTYFFRYDSNLIRLAEPVCTQNGMEFYATIAGIHASTFRFALRNDLSNEGSSVYLIHMETSQGFQGQGIGEALFRYAIARMPFFRVGTPANLALQPNDPGDEIELTDDGERFIDKMLNSGVLVTAHVFPLGYNDLVTDYFSDMNEE